MITVAERLWRKTDIQSDDDCWNWQGYVHRSGYGLIGRTGGQMAYAHRIAWEVENGDIPAGLNVCHTCDNRRCVNPSHLFLGTHQDNMRDMVRKGRNRYGTVRTLKITDADVIELHQLLDAGFSRKAVAERFGLDVSYVGHIRRGEARPLKKLRSTNA